VKPQSTDDTLPGAAAADRRPRPMAPQPAFARLEACATGAAVSDRRARCREARIV